MRSVVFRYVDYSAFSGALSETHGALPLPEGESVSDGEWVLAIFEIGSRRRATAAAARAVRAAGDTHLQFERRDWERLMGFVSARSEHLRAARPSGPSSSARFPVAAPVRESDVGPESSMPSSRVPFGSRVLVVDDDGRTGGEIRAMLAEMGLIVELVATTARAEARIDEQIFDAIVIDLHAENSDARAFVASVRSRPNRSDTPVLFIASKPTSRDVVTAFASGGDDYLPKPFRTPELAARIFGLLRRARLAGVAGGSAR